MGCIVRTTVVPCERDNSISMCERQRGRGGSEPGGREGGREGTGRERVGGNGVGEGGDGE
jgi:hypothetical protein